MWYPPLNEGREGGWRGGDRSVVSWECFGNNMAGYSIEINGISKKEIYLKILIDQTIPPIILHLFWTTTRNIKLQYIYELFKTIRKRS